MSYKKNSSSFSNEVKKMKNQFKNLIDDMSDEDFIDFLDFVYSSTVDFDEDEDEDFDFDEDDFDEGWEDEAEEFYNDGHSIFIDDTDLPF